MEQVESPAPGRGMPAQNIVILAASAAGMLGTFLPWVSTPMGSADGTRGDGWITLVLFGLALLCALRSPISRARCYVIAFAGVIALGVGGWDAYRVKQIQTVARAVDMGGGLYLVIFAAMITTIGTLISPQQKA